MKAKPGRREFQPTPAQRALAEEMASYGRSHFDICQAIGCSEPTLRKHFARELETALVAANNKVAKRLFQIATEGSGKEALAACIFWLKCRAGWRDAPPDAGKKVMAQEAATTAGRGTDWGNDLSPPPSSLN